MSHPRGPTPDLDPYFALAGLGPKGGAKKAPSIEEEIRREFLPAEATFRVAGTIAMVLGAAVFVIFAVPVSGMLRRAWQPGGVFTEEDWIRRRWVARMSSILTLAVASAAMGWGLRRRRPWARWTLIALGAFPLLAMAAGLGLKARGVGPTLRELADIMTMPCVGVVVFPAGIAACWAACSRRARAVFGSDYAGVVARTQELSAAWTTGRLAGLGLTLAMLVLYWTLLMAFLGVLVACGVIRTT